MLSVTVHGYVHVGGISTLNMEAEFSFKTRQNLEDYTVSRTDDDSIASNSTSLTTAYSEGTRVRTLIVATIYLQLIQNRYMFRSFTVLQCSHQHCVQPVASHVEVVGYL